MSESQSWPQGWCIPQQRIGGTLDYTEMKQQIMRKKDASDA